MDAKTIKQQISYWDAQLKGMNVQAKVLADQIKVVENTIKSLKKLLPKEEEVPVFASTFTERRVETESLGDNE